MPAVHRYRERMRGVRRWCVALLVMTALPATANAAPTPAPNIASARGSCATGGSCVLGDTGPGGGIVFYVSQTPQWWGQYLEVARRQNRSGSFWDSVVVHASGDAKRERILGKAIGAGATNTQKLATLSEVWRLRDFGNQFSSPATGSRWYVPSKDELDALYNYVATAGTALRDVHPIALKGRPYWTSSEASETFAWYQLFHNGTQFTDANGIVSGLTGNKDLIRSNAHKGSAFLPADMQFAFIRAFAPTGTVLPPRPPIPTVPAGGRQSATCSAGTSCQVGDIGPGGGLVFYDAGSRQPWGRWLEAAPAACQASGKVWRVAAAAKKGTQQLPLLYPKWSTAARQRVESKALGMGARNTGLIVKQHAGLPETAVQSMAAGYSAGLVCGGRDDWFLPSKDELDSLYNLLAANDHDLGGTNSFGFTRGYYWTSSEYNNETAWTQLWVDGQQFDREKWLNGDPRRDGGFNPFHVRPIRAFG